VPGSNAGETARRWLAFAEEDLRVAELVFGESLYNQVCFHSHQTAEKTLKALVAYKSDDPPRTHRLTELLSLLERSEPVLKSFADELNALDAYYIPTRYPDALPGSLTESLPGKDEAEEALATARNVFETIRNIIGNVG
jgi:HEPN domain-containing protein